MLLKVNLKRKENNMDQNQILRLWLQYNINMEARSLYLPDGTGEDGIDHHTANLFIKSILYMASQTDQTIRLYINCTGGCTSAGMAICDSISLVSNPVVGVVTGEASSMAAWILQFCNKRVMWPHSSLLVHYGTTSAELDPRHVSNFAKLTKQEEKVFETILYDRIRQKHPFYNIRRLRTLIGKDHPLSAREAVDLGLADLISESVIDV